MKKIDWDYRYKTKTYMVGKRKIKEIKIKDQWYRQLKGVCHDCEGPLRYGYRCDVCIEYPPNDKIVSIGENYYKPI